MGYKIYKVNNKGKGTFNDVPPEDIVEVGSNLSNGDVYDANSYSTDEIKTGGTWIDGKPIYTITQLTADLAPTVDIMIKSTVVGSTYTEYEYTKLAE